MRRISGAVRALTACAALLAAAGCTSREAVAARMVSRERAPDDFAMAVTVSAPSGSAAGLPRGQRPARYILEADGSLRVATGLGATTGTFPPVTVVLRDAQRQRVWSLVREAGFFDRLPAARTAAGGPDLAEWTTPRPEDPREPVATIAVQFDRERDAYRLVLSEEPAAAALIDELAAMAWVRE